MREQLIRRKPERLEHATINVREHSEITRSAGHRLEEGSSSKTFNGEGILRADFHLDSQTSCKFIERLGVRDMWQATGLLRV